MRVITLAKRKVLALISTVVLVVYATFMLYHPLSVSSKTEHIRAIEVSHEQHAANVTTSMLVPTRKAESAPHAQEKTNQTVRYTNFPPGIFSYLPHTAKNPHVLKPKLCISKGRTNAQFVIGIPSIKRTVDTYLHGTLESLLSGLGQDDWANVLIVVLITEPWDEAYEQKTIAELEKRFPKAISEGLLEVITPPAEFYPDMSNLKPTLGDSQARVKWRSKQNLDYVFLMLQAWRRGTYYIQLEDDITALPGYLLKMKIAIAKQMGDWFLLSFSELGFIGRLFKSDDVPKMMEFLLMFYDRKPCDWLMEDYLRVQACGHGENWKKCIQRINHIAPPIRPSLFQHQGYHSSLNGSINRLKDKFYGVTRRWNHQNPIVSTVITSLLTYSKYDIYSAYMGQSFFWGANPKMGDILDFIFFPALPIAKVYLSSGDKKHPDDKFRNTTVEVLPALLTKKKSASHQMAVKTANWTQSQMAFNERMKQFPDFKHAKNKDNFFVVGSFDETGIAECKISKDLGSIHILRLHVHSDAKAWVILDEIKIDLRTPG